MEPPSTFPFKYPQQVQPRYKRRTTISEEELRRAIPPIGKIQPIAALRKEGWLKKVMWDLRVAWSAGSAHTWEGISPHLKDKRRSEFLLPRCYSRLFGAYSDQQQGYPTNEWAHQKYLQRRTSLQHGLKIQPSLQKHSPGILEAAQWESICTEVGVQII